MRRISDPIYGTFEITEPILIDLLKSDALRRTGGVNQFLPYVINHQIGFTREEHGIGTMLQSRILGAEVDEQSSALLHDASHSAFSHSIDFLVGTHDTDNYQDSIHRDYIYKTDAHKIIASHGYDPERIADIESFGILERDAPDLCADRVDYTLREMFHLGRVYEARSCAENLTTYEGRIVFQSHDKARLFAENYVDRNANNWASPDSFARIAVLVEILQSGLDEGWLSFPDLHTNDYFVLDKIFQRKEDEIVKRVNFLSNGAPYKINKVNPQINIMNRKFRWVDPEFFQDGELVRLTDVDSEYKELLEEQRKLHNEGIQIDPIY